jgi:hypothetical protein
MKKFRNTKRFENFLRKSSQSTLELNEDQIDLLSPDLSHAQVLVAVENAGWIIQRSELLQNGLIIFKLCEMQVCSCGRAAIHFHFTEPCCSSQYCCPEFPEPEDLEIEVAWKVAQIRETLENRK